MQVLEAADRVGGRRPVESKIGKAIGEATWSGRLVSPHRYCIQGTRCRPTKWPTAPTQNPECGIGMLAYSQFSNQMAALSRLAKLTQARYGTNRKLDIRLTGHAATM